MHGPFHAKLTLISALAILSALASVTRADCPREWRRGDGLPGINGNVHALTSWDPDGSGPQPPLLIAGGEFTIAGRDFSNNIAAWNGTNWMPLGDGLNDTVFALTTYAGKLVAGGDFTTAGGIGAARVAVWNGVAWSPLGTGIGGSFPTVAAASEFNGELVVGGYFESAGGASARNIARWNGTAWQPLGAGTNNSVVSLQVHAGSLFVGGTFTASGTTTLNQIGRWNGSSWQALGSGMAGSGNVYVYALTVFNGSLVAGGNFSSAGGVSARSAAIWNGTNWQPLGTGITDSSGLPWVYSLAVYNGKLIAGGRFNRAGGISVSRIAAWTGVTWEPLGDANNGINDYLEFVFALAVHDGRLFVGGSFTVGVGMGADHITQWDGLSWRRVGAGISSLHYDPVVNCFGTYNGSLIAGGNFTAIGDIFAGYIARWDGLRWQPLGLGMDFYVLALATRDQDLFAAGWFDTAGGIAARSVAKMERFVVAATRRWNRWLSPRTAVLRRRTDRGRIVCYG